ncbi:DUF859 domain-containing protein [Streptococcus himalayensis]|uniref:Phage structural protein n=1 Tax=Streptococcus himalayensis TaxID=1888195 RepID=A0A917EDT8_9STRE|nr:DUF859 domain-containing protein [Streptococcus himalayensis]QBX25361.1 capsid and scaffold protein [Streptococcus phage Javan254]GGE26245.1 hypothetical protein GCM10011510_04250 [Streptococcus himalayensis]
MAEFWSNNDRGYRIRLWLDQASQNVSSNTSQVRVRLALINTTTTFAQYSCSAYVDLNGQRLNWSGSPSVLSNNSTTWLIDQTITVNHNADGSKSFGFMAHFNGSGGWSPGSLNIGSGTFSLTTIPRSSEVSVGVATIGSAVSININRASNGFTHTLRYQWGNKQGTIASNVGTSHSWTLPMDFCQDIPDSTVGSGTLYVDTYSGGSRIGTQSVTFTANVPASVVPSFSSVTLADTHGVAASLVGGNSFIQIISNIRTTFNGAVGSYGSTITGYYAEIVNKNQSTNANGGTLGVMNFHGSATIRASVIDSRGRRSATRDITINVLEYFAPILSFDVIRTGATSSILQINRNGRISPLTVGGSQKNMMTLRFKVAELGSNNYINDTGSAAGSWTARNSFTNDAANLGGTYVANKSYRVVGILEDKFTSTEFAYTVGTESVTLSYDKLGRLGVGKIIEKGEAGSIDAAGSIHAKNDVHAGRNIYANGQPIQQYQLTNANGQLSGGSNQWDDVWNKQATILGWRSGKYRDNPSGLNGEWGLFQNYWLDSWKGVQFFTTVGSGRHFIRVYNHPKEWKPTNWREVVFKDDVILQEKALKTITQGFPYAMTATLVRKDNLVTVTIDRRITNLPEVENAGVSERIPVGYRPYSAAVLPIIGNNHHRAVGGGSLLINSDGSMRLTSNGGTNVYMGTVSYVTNDPYPS